MITNFQAYFQNPAVLNMAAVFSIVAYLVYILGSKPLVDFVSDEISLVGNGISQSFCIWCFSLSFSVIPQNERQLHFSYALLP